MSTPDIPARATDGVDPDERTAERIREKLDTWAYLAESDLPIAEDAQRILDWLEAYDRGEFDE